MPSIRRQAPLPVAVVASTGPLLDLSAETVAHKFSSIAAFLLPPLRTVAEVDVYGCVDEDQPSWQTSLLREHLQPRRVWHFGACGTRLTALER
eukprot:4815428-Prymnesium_polylepis.1